MAEWIYDRGIGEDRAILVDKGAIIKGRIWRHDGIKPGLVTQAKLITTLVAGTRGIVRFADGSEALLSPLPKGLNEGSSLAVEVTRSAIDEKSRFKLPQVRAAPDKAEGAAPTLLDAIAASGLSRIDYRPHDVKDVLEDNGWSELLDEARTGRVSFDGGNLLIALTPAMTLIDIDGAMEALPLSLAAAAEAAKAIQRLGIQGNIGIDFPALADKASRQKVCDAFDAAMVGPCERTAINGFGFMQVVTRRVGQSLPELLQYRPALSHALGLLRLAQRDRKAGGMTIVAHPSVAAELEKRQDWLASLAESTGRAVALRCDANLAAGGGFIE